MTQREFQFKLDSGKTAQWPGTDWQNAAQRYIDSHPDAAIVAWRYLPTELVVGIPRIKEQAT